MSELRPYASNRSTKVGHIVARLTAQYAQLMPHRAAALQARAEFSRMVARAKEKTTLVAIAGHLNLSPERIRFVTAKAGTLAEPIRHYAGKEPQE